MNQLSKELHVARLGMASTARLAAYLKVEPGNVSVLALINDSKGAVELWVDRRVWSGDKFLCHPLVNTISWKLSKAALEKILDFTQHTPAIIDVPYLN